MKNEKIKIGILNDSFEVKTVFERSKINLTYRKVDGKFKSRYVTSWLEVEEAFKHFIFNKMFEDKDRVYFTVGNEYFHCLCIKSDGTLICENCENISH